MRRVVTLGSLTVVVMGVVSIFVLPPAAFAACHAFDVAVQPSNPNEGQGAQVVVSRDAAVNPSSVRMRTINQTAQAGADYKAIDRRVEFTNDVQQSFSLQTFEDQADEATETLRIELSQAQGCPINSDFTYGSAVVSIRDDDAPATTATTTPTTTGTTATTAGETTTSEAASTSSSSTSSTTSTIAADDTTTSITVDGEALGSQDDDDGSTGLIGVVAVVVALAVAGGVGYALLRRRAT